MKTTLKLNLFSARNKNAIRIFSIFVLSAFLNLEFGCNYYRVKKIKDLDEELSRQNLETQQKNNKYIIVHKNGVGYHLFNIQVDNDHKLLKASCEIVPAVHSLYTPNVSSNKRIRNSRGDWNVLNEVHIVSDSVTLKPDYTMEIPFASIKRIDIVAQDTGRIVASYIGVVIGIFALVGILFALLKESCPFVYVFKGQSYVFKGELFGGAIYKPLERDDYMPLTTLDNTDPLFRININNELKERQYINIAEVIVAEHEAGGKMLIDSKGNLHSVSNPQPAYEARLNEKDNYLEQLASVDSSYCIFNAEGGKHSVNELVLKFEKPVTTSSAKLILHAKNSLWLDFAFGEMSKLFGSYYNKWVEQKRTDDPEKLKQWVTEQYLPLSVYVKAKNEWKLVEEIPSVGPLAARDLCIPVNIGNNSAENVEIKLVCGFMFWEVDYAAIDFSADKNFTSYVLKPSTAFDEKGNNVSSLISNSDNQYLFQPVPGCETSITYKLPELNPEKQYAIFLHSRGYYEHVREYTGLPDKDLLMSFKKEGAFVDFSKDLYDKINDNISYMSSNNR